MVGWVGVGGVKCVVVTVRRGNERTGKSACTLQVFTSSDPGPDVVALFARSNLAHRQA